MDAKFRVAKAVVYGELSIPVPIPTTRKFPAVMVVFGTYQVGSSKMETTCPTLPNTWAIRA